MCECKGRVAYSASTRFQPRNDLEQNGPDQSGRGFGLLKFIAHVVECAALALFISASSIKRTTSFIPFLAFQPRHWRAFDGLTLFFEISFGRVRPWSFNTKSCQFFPISANAVSANCVSVWLWPVATI